MPIGSSVRGTTTGLGQRAIAPIPTNPLFGRSLSAVARGLEAVVVKYARNGRVKWVANATRGRFTDVAVDGSSNIIASFNASTGPVVFYNADGTLASTGTPTGDHAFLVKYNSEGTLLWTALLETPSGSDLTEEFNSVAVDSSGNIYATGMGDGGRSDTPTIAYNSDGTVGGSIIGGGDSAAPSFLIKYNASGFVQWAARQTPSTTGTSSSARGNAVALDPTGTSVYVGGSHGSGSSNTTLSVFNASGVVGGFVGAFQGSASWLAKYDSSGVVQWTARPLTVPGNPLNGNFTSCSSLTVDSSGDLYVVGSAGGSGSVTVTVANASGTTFATDTTSATDGFIIKYSPTGTVQWFGYVTTLTSNLTDGFGRVTFDPTNNNSFYVGGSGGGCNVTIRSGSTFGTLNAASGPYTTAFLSRWTRSGQIRAMIRAALPAGPASTQASGSLGTLAVDRLGNLIAGGTVGRTGILPNDFSTTVTDFLGGTLSLGGGLNLAKFDPSGRVMWVQRWEAGSVSGIATDQNCDIIAAGAATEITDCDRTIYGSIPSAASVAPFSAFLIKYSPYPLPQWVLPVDFSVDTGSGGGITLDSAGNMYTTFGTRGTVTPYSLTDPAKSLIMPGGTAFETLNVGTARNVLVFTKYDASANVQWMTTVRSATSSIITPIRSATDPSGNTYIGFNYSSTTTAFNASGTAFGTTLDSIGSIDAGIVKYDSSGTVQWVARMGTTVSDYIIDLKTDRFGNVYAGGYLGTGTFTAFNSSGTAFATTYTTTRPSDGWVAKYNTNGFVQWVGIARGSGTQTLRGIAVDNSLSVLVTGTFDGTGVSLRGTSGFSPAISNNAGQSDVFVGKYDSNGTALWVARISTTRTDDANCVATDSMNAVYVGGVGDASATLTAFTTTGTTGRTITTSYTTGSLGFIVKYNAAGTPQWIAGVVPANRASGSLEGIRDITVDSSDGIYAFLRGRNAAIFNSEGARTAFGSDSYVTTANGGSILKYNSNGQGIWMARCTNVRTNNSSGPGMTLDRDGNIYMLREQ